jgi:hypothetical protein
MKIQAVNNIQNNKLNPNFKGLWGKTSLSTADFDPVLSIPTIEYTYYYYPFLKETKEEIAQKQQEVQKAVIDRSEGTPKYVIHDFKVCTTLPFDEKTYNNYKKVSNVNKLAEKSLQIFYNMHKYIADKFLTSDFGDKQVSAANEKLTNKFNELGM